MISPFMENVGHTRILYFNIILIFNTFILILNRRHCIRKDSERLKNPPSSLHYVSSVIMVFCDSIAQTDYSIRKAFFSIFWYEDTDMF